MKTSFATAAAAVLLWTAPAAGAHQLDEFLQATTIGLERNQIIVELRLTPGIAVLPAVLAEIDTDGDGIISAAEQRAYAQRVEQQISLVLDGNRPPLTLVSCAFPSLAQLGEGAGEILLVFKANIPPGGPTRRLAFVNWYQSGIAAYLANCLVPDDPSIRIIAQRRNSEQSFYQIDYTQPAETHPAAALQGTK